MLAPEEAYLKGDPRPTPDRRGVSRRSAIEAAKEEVPTVELARRLCGEMRQAGARWVARCPLPGHEDRTPSFTVYPETDSWYCFGACQKGGDVIDLAAAVWSIENPATAAAEVLLTFSREIPPRPSAWFAKQKRQAPVRDAVGKARFEHVRRRLYRAFFAPSVARIEDVGEREAEAQIFWEATEPLARLVLSGMRDGGRDGR